MNQEAFFSRFRESVSKNKSYIDLVAETLDISYDAAYRRTTGKAKLTLDEAVTLAKRYELSLDQLMAQGEARGAMGYSTMRIQSLDDLYTYFSEMTGNLDGLGKEDIGLIYSAKDIPIFHFFKNPRLARFKMYAWLNLLQSDVGFQSYEHFKLSLDFQQLLDRLGKRYHEFQVSEMWCDTTVLSTLQQINAFHASGMMSTAAAQQVTDDLMDLILGIEDSIANDQEEYVISYSELLVMTNNALLIKRGKPVAGFVAYAMLGYVRFRESDICNRMHDFFIHQIKQSKNINAAGLKEQKVFFKKIYRRIERLQLQLNQEDELF